MIYYNTRNELQEFRIAKLHHNFAFLEIKNDEIVGTAGFIAPEFYQYGVKPTRYADI